MAEPRLVSPEFWGQCSCLQQSWGLGTQQSWGLGFQQSWTLWQIHGLFLNWVGIISFWTMAPRDWVTYCQDRGLSGHTSPSGECAYCFCNKVVRQCQRHDPYLGYTDPKDHLLSILKSQWCRASITFHNETQSGYTSLEVNCFSFFSEHHVFFRQVAFPTRTVAGIQLNKSKG
jgi:hypothetical protein